MLNNGHEISDLRQFPGTELTLIGQTVLKKRGLMISIERDASIYVGLYEVPQPF